MPIPCLTWIKRGVMSGRPQRVKLTNEEISQIVKGKQDHTNSSDVTDDSDESDEGALYIVWIASQLVVLLISSPKSVS